ncbi:MAG TPA: hypothetical protein VMX54_04525 [Vicinamibacteria bacterium]|nr:hypothetical protein [Vicinamibacteria bacterium]
MATKTKNVDAIISEQMTVDAIIAASKVETDVEVIRDRAAEADAAKRAHELEDGLSGLESDLRSADGKYTSAAADGDAAQVANARKVFIAADEAMRARKEHIRRAQIAAMNARVKREQTEIEAEQRVKEKVHAGASTIARRVKEAADALITALEDGEKLFAHAAAFAPWGSATANRVGQFCGLPSPLFDGRHNMPAGGAHIVGASLLEDRFATNGGPWGTWKKVARDAGLLPDEIDE